MHLICTVHIQYECVVVWSDSVYSSRRTHYLSTGENCVWVDSIGIGWKAYKIIGYIVDVIVFCVAYAAQFNDPAFWVTLTIGRQQKCEWKLRLTEEDGWLRSMESPIDAYLPGITTNFHRNALKTSISACGYPIRWDTMIFVWIYAMLPINIYDFDVNEWDLCGKVRFRWDPQLDLVTFH